MCDRNIFAAVGRELIDQSDYFAWRLSAWRIALCSDDRQIDFSRGRIQSEVIRAIKKYRAGFVIETPALLSETKMPDVYALHEAAFGRCVVLELRDDLVAHAHAETQFAFWLGGGRVQANLAKETLQYSEDVALGTNAYESHDARLLDKENPAVFLVFYLSKEWLDTKRAQSGRAFYFPVPRIPISAALRQACWRVLDILLYSTHDDRNQLESEIESLILAAVDATLAPHAADDARPRAPMLDRRLRTAIGFMREHAADQFCVEEIAAKVGLSRAHFFSLFRDQLNTTPQVFLSAVRVEEAVRRLILREDPLTYVAIDLGFSSPGNFSRFFREHMGVSPSGFRRASLGSDQHAITGVT
jgi:AraC-like DNA-binding protein